MNQFRLFTEVKTSLTSKFEDFIDINPEVRNALARNIPVVALESTIISHGMPYPQNVQVAIEIENVVRQYGAVPATCAVINGMVKVGLHRHEQHSLYILEIFIKL